MICDWCGKSIEGNYFEIHSCSVMEEKTVSFNPRFYHSECFMEWNLVERNRERK